ncbi:MAG: imidazole glycerol phosphate synthase subunit HisH [Alphaproteobacteria bacterium]|nr:imidazole glycerol phosphate synthase subunit HisH [Alphaproteobacteria bacterium]MDE2041879.1 imidazole glycerol phosphate synthase subunit HisH [Alphaproteobacteria bacterium]MDE2341188.1 imidazole glycerol phosphate synthase subunit HisH [Alphaproteobacteria bacterium]
MSVGNGSIALIDYSAGNLQSVRNALKTAGAENVVVTARAEDVLAADRIVLPGVGAFAHCMGALSALPGMVEALNEATGTKARPFLGICVGMQLMAEAGEEHGVTPGLSWIKGRVRALRPAGPATKIPHMGWNDVLPTAPHPLIETGEAYFLHSFAFEGADVLANTDHAGPVVAAIGVGNRIGVQFHPEKSQKYGLAFLERFLEWTP